MRKASSSYLPTGSVQPKFSMALAHSNISGATPVFASAGCTMRSNAASLLKLTTSPPNQAKASRLMWMIGLHGAANSTTTSRSAVVNTNCEPRHLEPDPRSTCSLTLQTA